VCSMRMSTPGAAKPKNQIKSWKTHLAADRTSCAKPQPTSCGCSCTRAPIGSCGGLRVSMPKQSMWRVAQFDTLRQRLIKLAARAVEMKMMIKIHVPTSCPAQDILSRVSRASSPEKRGVSCPQCRTLPVNLRTFSLPPSGLPPQTTDTPRSSANGKNHAKAGNGGERVNALNDVG
jgi:Transposase DDE domain group 1